MTKKAFKEQKEFLHKAGFTQEVFAELLELKPEQLRANADINSHDKHYQDVLLAVALVLEGKSYDEALEVFDSEQSEVLILMSEALERGDTEQFEYYKGIYNSEENTILDPEVLPEEDSLEESQDDIPDIKEQINSLRMRAGEIDAIGLRTQNNISEFIGMTKAFEVINKFGRTMRALRFRDIKESEVYKGFEYEKDGEVKVCTTWAEFCQVIGFTKQHIDNDILNLNTFGQEFMEHAEMTGLGYRKLKQLRLGMQDLALDEQANLEIEEAKARGPMAMLEALEDLQDRQKLLSEQVAELKDDKEAKDSLITKKSQQIDKLEEEMAKLNGSSKEARILAENAIKIDNIIAEQNAVTSDMSAIYQAYNELDLESLSPDQVKKIYDNMITHLNLVIRLSQNTSNLMNFDYDFIELVKNSDYMI